MARREEPATSPPATVGFIGLGSQGAPMARAIIQAGYDTVLWARRAETLDPFRGEARIASSPSALAEQADVIGICVVNDDDVKDVALRPDGLLAGVRPGATVTIHSTIHPATCITLGERFRERRVHVLDAPVSGGGPAVGERRLLVMVGGDRDAYDLVLPVLSAFGDPVVFLGALGSGQFAKLVNNLLLTANLSLAHQAVRLGCSLGIDEDALIHVLRRGSARSFGLEMYSRLWDSFESESPSARAVEQLLRKDVELAEKLANEYSLDADLLIAAADRLIAVMGNAPKS